MKGKDLVRPLRKIWMLSREYGDLAGAGGVKDVCKQLAESLARWSGRDVRVIMPLYGFMRPEALGFQLLEDPLQGNVPLRFAVDMNYSQQERREELRIWVDRKARVTLYLLESERFGEKSDVYTYMPEDEEREAWKQRGRGHFDYFAMNILLQKAALELMILLNERPDVIHCHDGHTAVIPALMQECTGLRSYFRGTGCVVTIHNAGLGYHQEVADLLFARAITGLPFRTIQANCLAGAFDPLLSASSFAVLNTVSENYARELQQTDKDRLSGWLGHELAKRGITLEGVTNGIEPADFMPARPIEAGIAQGFDPADPTDTLQGKKRCKEALLRQLAANNPPADLEVFGGIACNLEAPLFTFIGRLSSQKGVDLLIAALGQLFQSHLSAQALFLGSGGKEEELQLQALVEMEGMAGRICFLRGYSPQVANQVYAAGDFFVIPSRYEPCGLTDYIAQLFGNIPVVHHVGGLVKVVDGRTGIAYRGADVISLLTAMERALLLYAQPDILRAMQRQAVERIGRMHTWDKVMRKYLKLYAKSRMSAWREKSELHVNDRVDGHGEWPPA